MVLMAVHEVDGPTSVVPLGRYFLCTLKTNWVKSMDLQAQISCSSYFSWREYQSGSLNVKQL